MDLRMVIAAGGAIGAPSHLSAEPTVPCEHRTFGPHRTGPLAPALLPVFPDPPAAVG